MSGGEKKKKNPRSKGWEEAGSEFYQESYPGDADIEVLRKDPHRLATLLPSKQTRAVAATIRLRTHDSKTNRSTFRRHHHTANNRSRRNSTTQRKMSTTLGGDVEVDMPDLSEMKSNEQTAWEAVMSIKEKPITMARKREEKESILKQQHLRLQGFEEFKWKRKKAWYQFLSRTSEILNKIELWRRDLKNIEGRFGTGVVTYFRFIKWLFFLNLTIVLLIIFFILLPVILLDDRIIDCDNNNNNNNDLLLLLCENCYEKYYCSINSSNNWILSIVQGTGHLERSQFFYGTYPNETLNYVLLGKNMYFNIPLSYILITLVYFLISFLAIVRTGAKGFKERLIQGEGQFYKYSNLVFGGWDYCINNEKSSAMKHKAIYRELKTLVHIERQEEEKRGRTVQEKWKIFVFRFLVNSIVLAILLLSGGIIYYAFQLSSNNNTMNNSIIITENELSKIFQLIYEFLPSMTIVALNISVPFAFKFLISFEHYSPFNEIRTTLYRTVLLRLASILVFYTSMYEKITCKIDQQNCLPCWETYVGQQIYKLLLTDFAIQLGVTFLVNFLRALLAQHIDNKFIKLIGEQTFDLPKHSLDVVYTQTLCWIGIFFAPLLSIMASIMFFLLFYVKKFACLVNSKPSDSSIYRASKSMSLFMAVLLVSYLIVLTPIAYLISSIRPSRNCGPFRQLPTMWHFMENTFSEFPHSVQIVAKFLTSHGFAIPLFILLLLLLYYYSAVNSANRHMVRVLKNQLVLEGHDKKFLIDRLFMFIRQENEKAARLARRMMDGDTITNVSSIQS